MADKTISIVLAVYNKAAFLPATLASLYAQAGAGQEFNLEFVLVDDASTDSSLQVAESFFATLEHELLADTDFHTRREAHRAVAEFIEAWYNPERRHSTLGYVSPVQYEQQLARSARAA